MKNKWLSVVLLFTLILSCKTHKDAMNYVVDDDGISVERMDSTNKDENKYNYDNKIYVIGRKFTYSYYHLNPSGQKYLITKGKETPQKGYSTFDWDSSEYEKQNSETVKTLTLKVNPGNPFKEFAPDYSQTAILYEYITNGNHSDTKETTGAIENKENVWIHPPRDQFFRILEINPFPYIKSPFRVGTKWSWNLKIGDHWADQRWLKWEGEIENKYEYEIIDRKTIPTKLGDLKCHIVKGKAKSRIGETELIAYFNPTYGFVKLDYKNIDGSKTVLELEKME